MKIRLAGAAPLSEYVLELGVHPAYGRAVDPCVEATRKRAHCCPAGA